MKKLEETNEFVERLVDSEEIISDCVDGLNHGCPISLAKKRTLGLEKNVQITKITPEDFMKNPYLQNIYIGDWIVGNAFLNKKYFYDKDITLVCDSRKRDPKTLTTIYNYFYFTEKTNYPCLGTIFPNVDKWMGVEPGEIKTFAPFVKEAKGKVLLMGCGLGYLAYMLSIKSDIEEVTIVELDPSVKMMFECYLKPQMNKKINIIEGDAIEFLENENISKYQYCSVDIWHDCMDMLPLYLKCLTLEGRHPETKFHYWLEGELHTALESIWIYLLKRVINKECSKEDADMFTDILLKQNLETIEGVRNFLTAPKRPIIKEWAIENKEISNSPDAFLKILSKMRK